MCCCVNLVYHKHMKMNAHSKNSASLFGFVVVTAISAQGCILIYPNSRIEKWGITSRVVDAGTSEVISGAEIADLNDARRTAKCDVNGAFTIKPFRQWHMGVLISPISYPILPFTVDAVGNTMELQIAAPGYQTTSFYVYSPPQYDPERIITVQGRKTIVGNCKEHYHWEVPFFPLEKVRHTTTQQSTSCRSNQ